MSRSEIDSILKAVSEISEEKSDNVHSPNHYATGKYQCIEVMVEVFGKEAVMDFCICNAFKYIYRFKRKNGMEDIDKTLVYLNWYKQLSEKGKISFNED